jgi:hypothetical protein
MRYLLFVSVLLGAAGGVLAWYDKNSKSNLAVYWGQNSISHDSSATAKQDHLSVYCEGECYRFQFRRPL